MKHNFRFMDSCSHVEESAAHYGRAHFMFLQHLSGRKHTASILLQTVKPACPAGMDIVSDLCLHYHQVKCVQRTEAVSLA